MHKSETGPLVFNKEISYLWDAILRCLTDTFFDKRGNHRQIDIFVDYERRLSQHVQTYTEHPCDECYLSIYFYFFQKPLV